MINELISYLFTLIKTHFSSASVKNMNVRSWFRTSERSGFFQQLPLLQRDYSPTVVC